MDNHSPSSTKSEGWSKYAKFYDPIKIGSIDGTDSEPHDKAITRAINSEYEPNRHVKGRPECTLFVARLSLKTTKETIKDIFSKYGRLRRFRLVKDIVTGLPKGYAFIEYETEHAAEEAYRKANKMNVDGQLIFVDFECERLLKGWKPRRCGGGFGGKKESGQLRFGGRDRPFCKPISLELEQQKQLELKSRKLGHSNRKDDRRSREREHRRNRSDNREKSDRHSGRHSRERKSRRTNDREHSRDRMPKSLKERNGHSSENSRDISV